MITVTMEDGQVLENVDQSLLDELLLTGKVTDISGDVGSETSTSSSVQENAPLNASPSPAYKDPRPSIHSQGYAYKPAEVMTASSTGPASASAAPYVPGISKELSLEDTYGILGSMSTLPPGDISPFTEIYPETSRMVANNLQAGKEPYDLNTKPLKDKGALGIIDYVPKVAEIGTKLLSDWTTMLGREGAEEATGGRLQAGMSRNEVARTDPLKSLLWDPSLYIPSPATEAVTGTNLAPGLINAALVLGKRGAQQGVRQGATTAAVQAVQGDPEEAVATLVALPAFGAIQGALALGLKVKAIALLRSALPGLSTRAYSYILSRVPLIGSTASMVRKAQPEALEKAETAVLENLKATYPEELYRSLGPMNQMDPNRIPVLFDMVKAKALELLHKARYSNPDGSSYSKTGYKEAKDRVEEAINDILDLGVDNMSANNVAKTMKRYADIPELQEALEEVLLSKGSNFIAGKRYLEMAKPKISVGDILGRVGQAMKYVTTPEMVQRASKTLYGTIPLQRFPIQGLESMYSPESSSSSSAQ